MRQNLSNTREQNQVRVLRRKIDKLEEAGKSADEMAAKRGRVMNVAVASWQDQIIRRTFQNWRAAIELQKQQVSQLVSH